MQPRSPKQTDNRSLLTAGSSAWRTLSDVSRTAWNDYAAQILRSGRLGSSYNPTGAGLFSGAFIQNPGATINDPPSVLPTYVLVVNSIAYVDPTPGPEALNVTILTTSADNLMLAETSGPVSPGVTSAAAVRRWRSLPETAGNIRAMRYAMTASPVDIIAEYKFLFPSPTTGQTIWFRFREAFNDGINSVFITNKSYVTFRLIVP